MTGWQFAAAGLTGMAAGALGGLAGVGGSMIILPSLHWSMGSDPASRHHLYMAAAMIVNVAVAFPAAHRHSKAGAVRRDLLPTLLASTTVSVLVGVLVSNHFDGAWLKLLLAVFLVGYCLFNLIRLARPRPEPHAGAARTERWRLVVCGGLTGFVGGLLGLGGGVLLVPLLQLGCRVGLRQSIATSSAVIWITALFGATLKLATLYQQEQSAGSALLLAAAMAPTAIIGSRLGAGLTHSLPVAVVRAAITAILIGAALKLLGVW